MEETGLLVHYEPFKDGIWVYQIATDSTTPSRSLPPHSLRTSLISPAQTSCVDTRGPTNQQRWQKTNLKCDEPRRHKHHFAIIFT